MARATEGEAFLFYFERWRGSRPVQRMTFTERGIFLEMLIEQWMRGDIPDTPGAVADAIATSHAQAGEIEAAWPAVRRQFVTVESAPGRMQNLRLEEIRRERRAWLKTQKLAGQRGGERAAANRRKEKDLKPIGSLQAQGSDPIPNNHNHNGEVIRVEGKGFEERRATPRAHTQTVFEGALPRNHRDHVFCDETFTLCVPSAVHAKFIGPLSRQCDGDRERAHQRLLTFYEDVTKLLPPKFVMGDAFKFWQKHFDTTFASQSTAAVDVTDENYLAGVRAEIERQNAAVKS